MEACLRLDHSGRERGSNVWEAVQVLHNMETAQGSKRHRSEESAALKPGNEGPNLSLVIDFRPFPMGDCNYMPIVVNIAQDLNNLYIVLYKNWSQIKKNRDWSRNSDALPTNTYRFSASEL